MVNIWLLLMVTINQETNGDLTGKNGDLVELNGDFYVN